jgi:hypothetical protein
MPKFVRWDDDDAIIHDTLRMREDGIALDFIGLDKGHFR